LKLPDIYTQGNIVISFELFPPKTEKGMNTLYDNLQELVALNPTYITCTYGAGGSTRSKTLEVLAGVKNRYPHIPVASHLTCVGSTVDELRSYVQKAIDEGVEYIVALRGDPPQGETRFKAVEGGLTYANELVALLRSEFPELGIVVAGYPETHQEAPSRDEDLTNLKRKVDAGADVITTQLFYDNEDFLRWRDQCDRMGIDVPIVPGLFPVINFKQIQKITALCGAKLPKKLVERLEAVKEDPEGQLAVGAYYTARQVEELLSEGIPGVHLYVLNKARATSFICNALDLNHVPIQERRPAVASA